MDIAPITAGMNSDGCDRGPGSDAAFAHLDDVWSAEAHRGAAALVERALHAEPERQITALRAIATLPTIERPLLEALFPLANTRGPIVACERTNDAMGVYRLRFVRSSEARKTIATFASAEDIETVLRWFTEGVDLSVCGSDTVAQPRVVFARALARLDRERKLPWNDVIARALFENHLWEHERNAIFLAVREENPEACATLLEAALAVAPKDSMREMERSAQRFR